MSWTLFAQILMIMFWGTLCIRVAGGE
ncbi:hypothetical protein SEA_PATOS_82 [Gordonia phage Patos]|uniref:Uncharacterized protein n=1 Tax=Gordonia phage Patos TaxID=2927262 RepID=A0A9E7U4C4_9CAUD|nr:hypothetical protein SEA_PATOS_82 [Gordonia phage Patos]WNN95337.1 hypothetical protein SEA_NORMANRE_82 [Gordonia phage NorManre]